MTRDSSPVQRLVAALLVIALAAPAAAAPPPPAAPTPAAGPPVKVAVVPVREAAGLTADVAPLERALVEALRSVPEVTVVNVGANGRLTGGKGGPLEARVDPQPAARAPSLGRETGAARVLAAEAARLGEGRVLYLQGIDTATGKSIGSTTVALTGESELQPADKQRLRAGVVRALLPERNRGVLQLHVDVPGAVALVDGRIQAVPNAPIVLPAGTHALRITHPAYRDFLRFVDISFDQTTQVDVALSAYPLTEGEMAEKARREKRTRPLAWYQRWWVLPVAAVVLAGAAVGVTFAVRPGIASDQQAVYRGPPVP